MHYFKDAEDGEEYLYSHFECNKASLVFPCFDQPDIKAPYELMVFAKKAWIVISTEYHGGALEVEDQKI